MFMTKDIREKVRQKEESLDLTMKKTKEVKNNKFVPRRSLPMKITTKEGGGMKKGLKQQMLNWSKKGSKEEQKEAESSLDKWKLREEEPNEDE